MVRLACSLALLLLSVFGEQILEGESSGDTIVASSRCGNIDENWVLAANKYDLFSAEILNETTSVIKNATANNSNAQNSYSYRVSGDVMTSSEMNFERPSGLAAPKNLAAGKVAAQSSTDIGGFAYKAVDGVRDGDWSHGSVTHTTYGSGNYWLTDIGKHYYIDHVKIYNRVDCCQNRLSGAQLLIDENPTGITLSADNIQTYRIGKTGRFLRILQPRYGSLSVAEVEIYGRELTFLSTVPYFDRFGFLHVDVVKKQKLQFGHNLIYENENRQDCHFDIPPRTNAQLSITQTTRSVKLRTRQYWVKPTEKKCYKDIETTATLTIAGEHECEMKKDPMDS